MTNQRGDDAHGPGGDPSWLGGGDRNRGSDRPGGFSSDFSGDTAAGSDRDRSRQAPDSDFGGSRPQAQTPYRPDPAPERQASGFGQWMTEQQNPTDQAGQASWRPEFDGQPTAGQSRMSGKGFATRLSGWFTSAIGLVIFAFIASQFGMNLWWILVVLGLPLLPKLFAVVTRYLEGRSKD